MSSINLYKSMDAVSDQYVDEALDAKPVRRHRVRRAVIKVVAVAAALLIAFAGTVNLFPATAYALSDIPILGDIAKAVIFDPSLKECLSHSYVQYVGESHTVDGYHSEVYCMVVDPSRISVFFTTDVPESSYSTDEVFFHVATNAHAMGSVFKTEVEYLYEYRIDFLDGEQVPEELHFWLEYLTEDKNGDTQETTCQEVVSVEYTLYPDKRYSTVVDSYEINYTIELMGQTILIDRLDVYPTQAKLYFSMDEANTALLRDITITLVDERGRVYPERSIGITATGTTDGDMLAKWYETPYFSDAKSLTLKITAVSFQDKDKRYGTIDLTNETISNMPEGVSIASMILNDEGTLEIALKAPEGLSMDIVSLDGRNSLEHGSISGYGYWSKYFGEQAGEPEDGYKYLILYIDNYKDNTYQIEWRYASETVLETPIAIPVFD